jgi:hypothetical protein
MPRCGHHISEEASTEEQSTHQTREETKTDLYEEEKGKPESLECN